MTSRLREILQGLPREALVPVGWVLENVAGSTEDRVSTGDLTLPEVAERLLAERRDLDPGSPERRDIYHFLAYTAKVHRLIPESGYTARLELEDDQPLDGESHYRVRVEQRNAQRAWSSPIWVTPDEEGRMRE